MTRKWTRRGSVAILAIIAISNVGCVITSPLLNIRPSSPVIMIDVPPNRLAISGPMAKKDFVYLEDYLDMLLDEEYRKHQFKHKSGVDITYDMVVKQNSEFKSEVK